MLILKAQITNYQEFFDAIIRGSVNSFLDLRPGASESFKTMLKCHSGIYLESNRIVERIIPFSK